MKTKDGAPNKVTHFFDVFRRRPTARRVTAGQTDCLAKRRLEIGEFYGSE